MCLVLYVHGFMGSSKSFLELPNELSLALNAPHQHYEYQTKGNYQQKTIQLSEYLNSIKEPLLIVAHSMGGPLSIDASLQSTKQNIIGILTVDSPFFGLDQSVYSNGFDKVTDVFKKSSEAIQNTKNGWGFLALGVAATLALASNQNVQNQVRSLASTHSGEITERLDFLGPLWDIPNMHSRFKFLDNPKFKFKGFYLELLSGSRFSVLPPREIQEYFQPHVVKTKDTIEGHMNIFDPNLDRMAYDDLKVTILSILETWKSEFHI